MLQQIRDRTSGLIAGFIVALIAIPFAFFGIESFRSGGGDPVVAKVGDQKIHDSQFRRAYDQRYQQLMSLMGENFRADMIDQTQLRQSVLRDMAQETMLKQFTESEGYAVDDATVFRSIATETAFQRDGKFNTEAYRDALARVGFTPERYEARLRDSLEMNQMREAIVDTAFVTDVSVDQALRLAGEQRTIEYAVFDVTRYRAKANVTDDEVAARYEDSKAQYQAPERIKLEYVELSKATLPEPSTPGDDVLKALYDAEKDGRFTTQEERKASHILVSFGADKAAAKAKVEKIAGELAGGADFATLAKEYSDDTGSKASGGSLGWVKRGQMVSSFEDALYGLDAGQTSGPVETEFGWHLIHVDEIKPSVTRSFDDPEVKRELTELFQSRERQQRFEDMSSQLEQLAFENPTSLEPVASALGLKIQTTEWFTREGAGGITAEEPVRTAAFMPEIIDDGENSKPLAISGERLVVIRKADYEAPRQRTLDEVRETIRNQLLAEKARQLAEQDADEVVNAVGSGTAFQEIVSAKGAELRNPGAIRRDDKNVEGAVVARAFKLARPGNDVGTLGQAVLDDGSRVVIVLRSVTVPEQIAADQKPAQQQRLRDAIAGKEFGAYLSLIEDEVGIEYVDRPAEDATPDSGQ
ncbi:MAG: SurA N-terminal domain-containing protein [Nevskiales bacterium]|nr:SurA N-terminal domain-containing protein [Nevskiales bacterium]